MILVFILLMAGLPWAHAQAQTTVQDAAALQAVAGQPLPSGPVHIVPFGRNGSAIKNTAAPAGAHLTYWGGPVISQVHVVAVFWGPNVNTAITAPGAIDQFFRDITNSRYYDLLTEYSTVGVTGAGVPATSSNQSINRGVFDLAVQITPSVCNVTPPIACTITDAQIRTELTNQINAHQLPVPMADVTGNIETFYMIYFPPGVTITAGTLTSCVQGGFCAYHSNVPSTLVPYGVLPDFAGACLTGCGRGTLFQNVTAVTSHELSEAVTDPQIGSATNTAPPLAWYDADPVNPLAEIGDICGGQDVLVNAGLNTYSVQQEFSNLQNDCVSAPPSFALTLPPSTGLGVSFNLPVTIQSSAGGFTLGGYTGMVHFTSSDSTAVLPSDYTFVAADAGTHTFPATLNTLGNQTITVTDTRSAGFTGTATTNVNTIPDLVISKTHAGNFTPGQTGSYTITVSNSGNGPTTAAVTVTDTLPFGLAATAISGTGWTCDLPTLTCTRTDALARGSSYPAITLAVNVAANAPLFVTNSATVSGGGETNTVNDTATDFTTISEPDLFITKQHFSSFFVGQTGATYTLTVFNHGTLATTGAPVNVVDTLPAGLNATAIGGTGWSCTLATLTCTRSDVLAPFPNSYPPITVTVDVTLTVPGTVINVATVSGGGDTTPGNNVAQDPTIILPPPAPDLSINLFHLNSFIQGQTGTYFITVSNVGTAATTAPVRVTDTLPAGLTAAAMTGPGWTCDLLSVSCTRNDALAVNGSYPQIALTVNVAPNAPTSVTDTATVSGGGDANTANNAASDLTQTVPPVVDLAIQVPAQTPFAQGLNGGSFTISVSNLGNVPSTGVVTVADTLPAGFTATAMSGTGWTCTLGTVTCSRSDALGPSTAYPAITLVVNVAENASTPLTDTVTVSGGGDTLTSNNTVNLSIFVLPGIQLSDAGPRSATIAAGGTADFFFNAGAASTAGGVLLVCSGLPPGTLCRLDPFAIRGPVSTLVDMSVTTTARAASPIGTRFNQMPFDRNARPLLLLLAALATVLLFRMAQRRWRPVLGLAGLLVVAAVVGCGGGSGTQNQNGTPAGTYTITVTASGSTAPATMTFTLNVK